VGFQTFVALDEIPDVCSSCFQLTLTRFVG